MQALTPWSLLVMAGAGLALIVTQGEIFRKTQALWWGLRCAMCVGFWCGVALAIVSGYSIWQSFLVGLASSGLGFGLGSVTKLLDSPELWDLLRNKI